MALFATERKRFTAPEFPPAVSLRGSHGASCMELFSRLLDAQRLNSRRPRAQLNRRVSQRSSITDSAPSGSDDSLLDVQLVLAR